VAAVFFSLGVLTRLPFRAQLVQEWDAGCFALAVEQFDVRLEQPHRPGTFMVYIMLARGLNLLLHDSTQSLVWLSVIATGLAAAGMYLVARLWFQDDRIPWVAASLLLASSIVWFYGEMPLSYVPELAWVLWTVVAATYTHRGSKTGLWALAILMGLAGGIRPNTPFFLLPLALWAVWSGWRRRGFRRSHIALAVLLGLVAVAAWMLPLFESSGGAARYWSLIQGWMRSHSKDNDSWYQLWRNFIVVKEAILLGMGLATLPLVAMLIRYRQRLPQWVRCDWRAQAFLLWIIPGLVYLIFLHIQRHGHAFTIVPAWTLLAAVALVGCADLLQKYHRHAGWWLIVGVIGGTALVFPFAPSHYRTWETIRRYDLKYSERIEFVRSRFSPETTAVLAHPFYGRLPDLYLPNFQERHLSRLVKNRTVTLPPQVRTLVLLDNKIYKGKDDGFETLRLPQGGKIRYRTWSPEQRLKLTRDRATLLPAQASQQAL
jgi:hypothetical protein